MIKEGFKNVMFWKTDGLFISMSSHFKLESKNALKVDFKRKI